MFVLAHQYDEPLTHGSNWFRARVYGQVLADGSWGGWLVFFPTLGGEVVATERETTQSTLEALSYWASGLTPVYLHGALARALALQPQADVAIQLQTLERREALAEARADLLEREAAAARAESRAAEAARERTEELLLKRVAKMAETETQTHARAATASRAVANAAERALRARKPSARSRNTKKKR